VIAGWLGAVLAGVVGLLLAGLAAFGVINSASNGSGSSPITSPLVVYGNR
jgi:hypothetical protein